MTEILAAVIGPIAAGVVGYFLGRSQAQQQVFYESQAKSLTQIRLAVLSVTDSLKDWVPIAAGAVDAAVPVGQMPAPVSLATVTELISKGKISAAISFIFWACTTSTSPTSGPERAGS